MNGWATVSSIFQQMDPSVNDAFKTANQAMGNFNNILNSNLTVGSKILATIEDSINKKQQMLIDQANNMMQQQLQSHYYDVLQKHYEVQAQQNQQQIELRKQQLGIDKQKLGIDQARTFANMANTYANRAMMADRQLQSAISEISQQTGLDPNTVMQYVKTGKVNTSNLDPTTAGLIQSAIPKLRTIYSQYNHYQSLADKYANTASSILGSDQNQLQAPKIQIESNQSQQQPNIPKQLPTQQNTQTNNTQQIQQQHQQQFDFKTEIDNTMQITSRASNSKVIYSRMQSLIQKSIKNPQAFTYLLQAINNSNNPKVKQAFTKLAPQMVNQVINQTMSGVNKLLETKQFNKQSMDQLNYIYSYLKETVPYLIKNYKPAGMTDQQIGSMVNNLANLNVMRTRLTALSNGLDQDTAIKLSKFAYIDSIQEMYQQGLLSKGQFNQMLNKISNDKAYSYALMINNDEFNSGIGIKSYLKNYNKNNEAVDNIKYALDYYMLTGKIDDAKRILNGIYNIEDSDPRVQQFKEQAITQITDMAQKAGGVFKQIVDETFNKHNEVLANNMNDSIDYLYHNDIKPNIKGTLSTTEATSKIFENKSFLNDLDNYATQTRDPIVKSVVGSIKNNPEEVSEQLAKITNTYSFLPEWFELPRHASDEQTGINNAKLLTKFIKYSELKCDPNDPTCNGKKVFAKTFLLMLGQKSNSKLPTKLFRGEYGGVVTDRDYFNTYSRVQNYRVAYLQNKLNQMQKQGLTNTPEYQHIESLLRGYHAISYINNILGSIKPHNGNNYYIQKIKDKITKLVIAGKYDEAKKEAENSSVLNSHQKEAITNLIDLTSKTFNNGNFAHLDLINFLNQQGVFNELFSNIKSNAWADNIKVPIGKKQVDFDSENLMKWMIAPLSPYYIK